MYKYRILSFAFFLLLGFNRVTNGQTQQMKCFNCIAQAGDNTCLTDPDDVSTGQKDVECEEGWCTTMRQEYTDMPGKIVTFVRACEKKSPQILNGVITNAHFTTFYRSCRTLLCNSHDGLIAPGAGEDGGLPETDLIVVAEDTGSAVALVVNLGVMSLGLFLTIAYSC